MVRCFVRPSRIAAVLAFVPAILACPTGALAQARQPLLKRLDDATRAKVLAALAGLVILGFAMVLLTWLLARLVQRYRHGSAAFRPTPRPGEHDWAKKPLTPSDGPWHSDHPDEQT
jgi:hypothetical protein